MEYDEKIGFGSNYEKFILNNIFVQLIDKLNIRSVLEYPANNLMGNHREIFEKTSVDLNSQTADLVWNFCEFEKTTDSALMIKEMFNKSNKYLFIITGNKRNLGVLLHRFWHLLIFKKWNHGQIKKMDFKELEYELKKFNNIKIKKIGVFDIPWFILDVYECGKILKFFDPHKKEVKEIKPTIFEKCPFFIKKFLAHHFYILAEKI
jgi:hypothetical protein